MVEFGDGVRGDPFTSDYDNILLSLSLIGDRTEFEVSEPGHDDRHCRRTERRVFRTFDFEASGNVMILQRRSGFSGDCRGQVRHRYSGGCQAGENSGLSDSHELQQRPWPCAAR
jgi:hypothetical protein